MTEPTRGARVRRGNRGPGSLLLTALLVLAIVASSALVFTNEVQLLKLAVIIALWAAVVAAFVSFIYRRQADVDAAKSRDLKLVYDLQLDREISARREYELSVEAQLRRELASELRAHSSDEVASLRAELAALRANLEILFDADLQHRPAIETERSSARALGDWGGVGRGAAAPERTDGGIGPGRVISSRIDIDARQDSDPNTEESPIIDVPAEPHPFEDERISPVPGGVHRRPSEPEPADAGWRPPVPEMPRPSPEVRFPWLPPQPAGAPQAQPHSAPPPHQEPERVARHAPPGPDWRPAPAEGQFIPARVRGSNWAGGGQERSDRGMPSADRGVSPRAPEQNGASPAGGKHGETPLVGAGPPATFGDAPPATSPRRARHSADADPGRRPSPPEPDAPSARHREVDEPQEPAGQHIGGQPVSELMARLAAGPTGGGRRRRREE